MGLVLVCGGGTPGWAGDKVTFTDAEDAAPRVQQSTKTKTATPQKRRLENFLDQISRPRGGGSLEAVAPPPFATATPDPGAVPPLTEKEWQQLWKRQNWIQRRPEDLGKPERDASGLLGVRESNQTDLSEPSSTSPRARQGWLVEYYEQLGKARSEAESAVPEPLRDPLRSGRERRRPTDLSLENPAWDGQPSARTGESLKPVEAAGFSPGVSISRNPAAFAPERARETRPGVAEETRNPAWLRGASAMDRVRLPASPLAGPASPPGTPPLEGVARILGQNPIASPLAGNALAANPLSSLDPVTAYPDPTRELLNPVTPVKSGPGPEPGLTISGPGGLETAPTRSRMLSGSPGALSSVAPAGSGPDLRLPAPSATEERRGVHSIKLNLELPRRSF